MKHDKIFNMTKIPELILPAADLNRTKYAFMYGADSVYGGLPQYSLRKAEVNFTLKSLKEAIEYAHSLKKKFYITLNIFPKNSQIETLKKEIKKLAKLNPDAFIISDPGLIQIAKKLAPKIRIHLSTQANTLNYESVRFWKAQGVKRIVLARELTLKEIKEIRKKVKGIELECFVHGAMCISYSGRCLMSAFMTGRESNQGLCTQPCRWQYGVISNNQFPISNNISENPRRNPRKSAFLEEDENGTYIMNSKDLCLIEHLDKLADAGVSAFKIEGRNKSEYYVAIVARAYRKAIDILVRSRQPAVGRNKKLQAADRKLLTGLKQELETLNYRDYTTGFLFGKARLMGETYNDRAPIKKWDFVGVVKEVLDSAPLHSNNKIHELFIRPKLVKSEGGQTTIHEPIYKIEVRNKIKKGDELELITPTETIKFKIKDFYNLRKERITEASPGNKNSYIFAELPEVPTGTLIRKKLK